jgi:hypothetical protein
MTTHRHLAALLGLLTALAGPAQAHKASDAYLRWHIDGSRVEQRVDIALRDLDRELTLDADDDGQLNWGEVRRRWADIERLADQGLQVSADGQPCAVVSSQPPQLDQHTDGQYAVLQRRLQCGAAVRTLEVDYRLFATSDATHRGIARIEGITPTSAVLVPAAGLQRYQAGVDGMATGRSFAGFVAEGLHHIVVGLDHLLFLVTLLMVTVWRRDGAGWVPRSQARAAWVEALGLVSAFTVSHSITLALAAGGVLAPPTRWVESLIAISVLVAAVDNLRPFVRGPRWVMVSVFGLVHGFGFAGPLQDLGLRQGALALPLLGFNLGVELGQLALVALLLPLATALRGARWYRLAVVRGGSAAVATLAFTWTLERSLSLHLLP